MIGYLLEQELGNLLPHNRPMATILTRIEVDPADPAFAHPTKPIGPVYDRDEAERHAIEKSWTIAPDGDKWRRVVPSPQPRAILEIGVIDLLVREKVIVVCAGGGGIPVVAKPGGDYEGIEAVIDKDLTSSVLATDIGAGLLVILTAVPQVYINFGKPNQQALGAVTLEELERLQEEGHFAPGSMGPKIEAVIHYLREGGRRALITNPESLPMAIEGRAGTHFVGKI